MSEEIVNPNEHLIIPDWINEKYFTGVLAKDEPNHVKILKFTKVAAIPPGENFTSTMIRVYIKLEMKDGSVKTKTYIFKTMLPEERGGSDINDFGLFPKEAKMYETYLPAFESMYRAAGWKIQLAPQCLHTEERNGNIHFIFEDLCVKRFKNIDRTKGLDLEHMTRALHKLAEYHAASAVYEEQHGPYPTEFLEGFVTLKTHKFHMDAFKLKERAFKKAMLTWGMDDAEKYVKEFPTADQYWAQSLSCLDVLPNEFNVLNHGDFWSSNLMSNYLPNGKIDELILVDFQIVKWGNPAQDLLFFIILSAATDIRIKEFDNLVRIYWDRLIVCLKVLKFKKPIPTLRDIQRSMYAKENSFYAFFALMNHLPIILFPTDKDSNLHNLSAENEEGESLRLRLVSNPAFASVMKDLYPFLYNRGLLNFSDYDV
ncbi:uncharacterized protein LOC117585911 [Drosophila guanche]|uniref:CHK kinase-like domain-containing protein n=1 Tax=Drosophila guanche TaxID=7266 RepID=A0A3B0JQB7_DROGU|nr:uncharacterized protein LOC117585911 [Drosophila guanche]SPP84315.1 Hypothetical predicted protein [Drosophila guanche]